MAYTPINWQTGDTITAEKMNKMDNGWGVQETQLFSETVTTTDTGQGFAEGEFLYGSLLSAPTIKVTFNGTDYTVNRGNMNGQYYYGEPGDGAPSFVNYPFFINSIEGGGSTFNYLLTASAGTYTVAVSGREAVVSDDFSEAVNNCVDTSTMPLLCISGETTYDEFTDAMGADRIVYFATPSLHFANSVSTSGTVSFFPEDADITAKFENNIFTVTWV